jgi:hypothetical protein
MKTVKACRLLRYRDGGYILTKEVAAVIADAARSRRLEAEKPR